MVEVVLSDFLLQVDDVGDSINAALKSEPLVGCLKIHVLCVDIESTASPRLFHRNT